MQSWGGEEVEGKRSLSFTLTRQFSAIVLNQCGLKLQVRL